MKAVKFDLAGRTRHLAFTVEAMFQLEEQFGGTQALLDAIQSGGREGFSSACRAAAILAEQGELARRSLGYDPEPMADADEIAAAMTPADMMALKLAIPAAMSLGYGREVEPENDEVDLGLAELNAQKKNTVTRAHYIRMGTACGLSMKDVLLSPPGEVDDLWELYLRAHGVKRNRDDD